MSCNNQINLPTSIYTGKWCNGHIQGIALDTAREYIYYSFTTVLVKSDLQGNIIGSVKGITGHLGCLTFNNSDGCVWGSIEYKHDAIGKGIMQKTGVKLAEEDAFYVGIFDVSKIDRMDMDAESDGIMTAVYLPDVINDYASEGTDGNPHHLACSGIDGIGFGPEFGAESETELGSRGGTELASDKKSDYKLYVAYGIYGDINRTDNDHQVILEFDWKKLKSYAKPLVQGAPHHSGCTCENKLFFYTGNTSWGVQNLEYDSYLDAWLVAVYLGNKPQFPNPPMFIIDRKKAPVMGELKGTQGERGLLLTSAKVGTLDEATGAYGISFPYGQTGMFSLGDGYYYFSVDKHEKIDGTSYFSSEIKLYRFTGTGNMFDPVLVTNKTVWMKLGVIAASLVLLLGIGILICTHLSMNEKPATLTGGEIMEEPTPVYEDTLIYYVDNDGSIAYEEIFLKQSAEDVFEAWKKKNGIGDEVTLIDTIIKDNGTTHTETHGDLTVLVYTRGDYFELHVTISKNIENYFDNLEQETLLDTLEKTMRGYINIEFNDYKLIME